MLRRSVSTASAMPGYCTLTATSRPSCVLRPVDLADRRRGEGLVGELGEVVGDLPAQVLLDDLADRPGVDRRDVVAQGGQALLEGLALALGHDVPVDRREHLADLHGGALHLPELLDELVGGAQRPLAAGLVGPLVGAHGVRRAVPEPARALPGDEAAELRGATEAGGGDARHGPEGTAGGARRPTGGPVRGAAP